MQMEMGERINLRPRKLFEGQIENLNELNLGYQFQCTK